MKLIYIKKKKLTNLISFFIKKIESILKIV